MSSGRPAWQFRPDAHADDRETSAISRRTSGGLRSMTSPSFPTDHGPRWQLRTRADGVSDHIRGELATDRIYLAPLRLFIGIGWLRAFAEKAIDSGWRSGTGVSDFLQHQLATGQIVFPAYGELVTGFFLPHAAALGWVIIVGQLLTGLAILCGAVTRAALIGGLFMNLNFLLAGAPEPSAFYIVIQVLLLLMGAGAIVGVDAWLFRRAHPPLLIARLITHRWSPSRASTAQGVMLLALAVVGYGLAHVSDWSPGGSIHDPAMVLVVLASLGAGWAAVALLRAELS